MRHVCNIWSGLKQFLSASGGNIAVFTALAAVPVMAAAGGAVDMYMYVNNRTALQAVLDSASLAAATAPRLTNDKRVELANQIFDKNIKQGDLKDKQIEKKFMVEGRKVFSSATTQLPTYFMRVANINTMELKLKSEISIPEDITVEVALVLDYSYSMMDPLNGTPKYHSMRDAAKKLITDLSNDNPEKFTFSLVPFSHHVYTTLPNSYVLNQPSTGDWTGCTVDRQSPFNTTADTPTDKDESKWGQPQDMTNPVNSQVDCTNPERGSYVANNLIIKPLTNNIPELLNQLDTMIPYAATHIALGAEFGYHTLSPNEPYAQGKNFGDKSVRKIMVILTDGAQTEYAYGPDGSRTQEDGEKNLGTICTNMKKDKIRVMTIAFALSDTDTTSASTTHKDLEGCATNSKKDYFPAENISALENAFEEIKKQVDAEIYVSN